MWGEEAVWLAKLFSTVESCCMSSRLFASLWVGRLGIKVSKKLMPPSFLSTTCTEFSPACMSCEILVMFCSCGMSQLTEYYTEYRCMCAHVRVCAHVCVCVWHRCPALFLKSECRIAVMREGLSSKHPCQLTGCWAQCVGVVEWEWSYERRGRQAQGWEGGSKQQWPGTGVVLDCPHCSVGLQLVARVWRSWVVTLRCVPPMSGCLTQWAMLQVPLSADLTNVPHPFVWGCPIIFVHWIVCICCGFEASKSRIYA